MDLYKMRTTCKLTAKQLADYLKIDEDTYNALELGTKVLTSDQLEKLEALYFKPEFFEQIESFQSEELKAFANINRIAMNQDQIDKISNRKNL